MTTYILNGLCIKLKSLFDKEMKVCSVSKQCINIKTMCPKYILEIRNTLSHSLYFYLGAWVKIETVIENHVLKLLFIVTIVFKPYPRTYCLMQGSCLMCSKFDP